MIYLDNAATTLVKPPQVKKAVIRALDTCANAGRGGHKGVIKAGIIAENCRQALCKLFNFDKPDNIIFTQNATAALNIAIKALAKPGSRALVSSMEHNAVMRPLNKLRARQGIELVQARAPLFDSAAFLKDFTNCAAGCDFAVINHVSNVFGWVLPIYEIDRICAQNKLPLVIDASQSAGVIDLDFSRLAATKFVCMPGHKALYGPQGTGVLAILDDREYNTIIEGGTGSNSKDIYMPDFTPDRFEAGTLNMPGIAGLGAGVEYVLKTGVERIRKHETGLVARLADMLGQLKGVRVFAPEQGETMAGVLSFYLPDLDCSAVANHMNALDIAVRTGFHCAPEAHKTAGTLESGTVRVSVSAFNTNADILAFYRALEKLVK